MTNRSQAKSVHAVDLATHPRAAATSGLINIRQVLTGVNGHGEDGVLLFYLLIVIIQTRDILYLDVKAQDVRHALDFLYIIIFIQ